MNVREHLVRERGLDLSLYTGVHIDEDERLVQFYLWNSSGKPIGYHQYRPDHDKKQHNAKDDGRYFTYVSKESEGGKESSYAAVWGVESLDYRPDVLVVVEGLFKAVPFHNRDVPAIAVFSNNPKRLKNLLYILSAGRRIVFVGDNDGGGSKTKSFGYEMVFPPDGWKDPDSMPPDEFDGWLRTFIDME